MKYSIAFANSKVVTPPQNALEYPFMTPFCDKIQFSSPIPLLLISGPIIEVLIVI